MGRVRVKLHSAGMRELLQSSGVAAVVDRAAQPVADAARADPNPAYTATIRVTTHTSPDRVSARVGAAPGIGPAVEAKRGTLARALGQAAL